MAYGDTAAEPARRYDRTREFLQLVRRLWREENVTFHGEYFGVEGSTVSPRPYGAEQGRHPRICFGGASAAAERVSAAEADVQLFWGEPLDGIAERVDRLRALSESAARVRAPLEFGLRITTLIRDTTEQAWHDAEAKVAKMAAGSADPHLDPHRRRGGPASSGSSTSPSEARSWTLARIGDQLISRLREQEPS